MPASPPDLPPRRFPLRALGSGTAFVLLFGGIWFAVGAIITTAFTAGGGGVWNDFILDRRGVTVDAAPIAVEPTNSSVNGRRVFRIVASCLDRQGVSRTAGGGTTDPWLLAQAQQRRPMSIDYDPEDPGRARLTGGSASFFGWFVLFPLGFAVIGAALLANGARRGLRTRAIYVHGQAAEAEVTRISPTNMRMNGRRLMRVDYTFDALTGRAAGHTTSTAPPAVGHRMWIIYRSSVPADNVPA
jgi:hypothetical protein